MAGEPQRRGVDVGDLPGRRRTVILVVGALFWTWLLARWAYHNTLVDWIVTGLGFPDLVRSDQGVRAQESWFPAAPFQRVADGLTGVAESLGPASLPVDWAVWLFELAAFATTAEPALAAGAFITVYMTVLGMAFGLLLAVPLSVARVYGGPITSNLSLAYTELIRGTPLLAQLFFLYFGLPLAGYFDAIGFVGRDGIPRAAVAVAIVGFTINSAAYQAEYIRSALGSVDERQFTAGRAVGLTRVQTIRHVVLPQGLRYAIPGWTNEFVYLLKYSSLAAFITVPELFRRARDIGSDTFQFTDIYVIVAVVYLLLVLTTTVAMGRVERWVAIPGVGTETEKS